MGNLFERLNAGRPPPAESQSKAKTNTVGSDQTQKLQNAQKLLNWLLHRGKPTVYAREIHLFGPYTLRQDRERAIDSAETLVRYGWLTPAKKHRRDGRAWELVQKPVIPPNVAG